MIKRREFIAGLGGAAAWPMAVRAQQFGRMPRVGVLMGWTENEPEFRSWLTAFVTELARLGWVDGRNVRIDVRWTNNDNDRTRVLAEELVQLRPDVILVGTNSATAAVHRETLTIPIVFSPVADPIASGFVAGFPRPGGNLTGFTNGEPAMGGKWLQLIKEIAPGIMRAAAMYYPDSATSADHLGPFKAAAQLLAIEPIATPVRSDAEIEAVIDSLGRDKAGLVILTDAFMGGHRGAVIAAATRNKVPSIFDVPFFPREGGLLSYGPSFADIFRRAAGYVDRILRGEKPVDLPVQAPIKYHLAINLGTAKEFGLTVPNALLVSADEVIE
jgi:putative tryptophan/tyrosine transport system substrate-binding protein